MVSFIDALLAAVGYGVAGLVNGMTISFLSQYGQTSGGAVAFLLAAQEPGRGLLSRQIPIAITGISGLALGDMAMTLVAGLLPTAATAKP